MRSPAEILDARTGSAPSREEIGRPEEGISVVIPVYQGERTLPGLLEEILPWTSPRRTPQGHAFRVTEVILVHDGAVDDSAGVMTRLAERYPFVNLIWLSRNFGQHAALVAGMARSSAAWVATLDEDGQHDPADLGRLLDRALETRAQLVYARPTNQPPHGALRNLASSVTKWISGSFLSSNRLSWFHSYRLIEGEVARRLSDHCATIVYLDVALSWVVSETAVCPLFMRPERGRRSGFTFGKLFAHFWRLVLSSGTKPLRMVAAVGLLSILGATAVGGYALWSKFVWKIPVQGWTSLMIALCVFSGVILFSLAVIAEYLGVALTMAMGKPLYLIVSRPCRREVPKA